jgi:hypothetical protein
MGRASESVFCHLGKDGGKENGMGKDEWIRE